MKCMTITQPTSKVISKSVFTVTIRRYGIRIGIFYEDTDKLINITNDSEKSSIRNSSIL